jgi:hypothetical protein
MNKPFQIEQLSLLPRILLNRYKLRGEIAFRQLTAKERQLPAVIIIGAMKSGSTSLFHYLGQHSKLAPSFTKEVHYFDGGIYRGRDNYKKGGSWYQAHFPYVSELTPDTLTFEATPLYMSNPLVPQRIFQSLPNVKLIAVLRNPTERAISHYFHEFRYKREPLPMLQAFQAENSRIGKAILNSDFTNKEFIHFSYKYRGLYKEQLARYYKYFSKRQVLILDSNQMLTDPEAVIKTTLDFIGADSSESIPDMKPQHITSNREKVDTEVYQYLNEYFEPHNRELYDLLNMKFDW